MFISWRNCLSYYDSFSAFAIFISKNKKTGMFVEFLRNINIGIEVLNV